MRLLVGCATMVCLVGCGKARQTSGHHDFSIIEASSTRADGKPDVFIESYKKSRVVTAIMFDKNGDGVCEERFRFCGFNYEVMAVDRDANLDGVYESVIDRYKTEANGVPQEPMKCELIKDLVPQK